MIVEYGQAQGLVDARCHGKDVDLQFDTANNGQEAIELVGRNGYDLILMDMQMPLC